MTKLTLEVDCVENMLFVRFFFGHQKKAAGVLDVPAADWLTLELALRSTFDVSVRVWNNATNRFD